MLELAIKPHQGIGPILLGANRETVRAALADVGFFLDHHRGTLDYFADNAIQVEYDDDDCSEFIGISQHHGYTLTYFGLNVFDTMAGEVFAAVAAREGATSPTFNSSEHVFPRQIVTLWEADAQYDWLGGKQRLIWAQIGVGNDRYLRD